MDDLRSDDRRGAHPAPREPSPSVATQMLPSPSTGSESKPELSIGLRYHRGKPVLEEIKRMSRPGLRQYRGKDDIPSVRGGLGVVILSTNKGVMTDRAARAAGVGGELLCSVF